LAKENIDKYCKEKFHPIRSDKKETVRGYNSRVKEDAWIANLKDDDVYAYR